MIPLYDASPALAEYKVTLQQVASRVFAELPEELTARQVLSGEYVEFPEHSDTDLALLHEGYIRLYYRNQHVLTLEPGDPIFALPTDFSLRAEGACEVYLMPLHQLQSNTELLADWLTLLTRWPGCLFEQIRQYTPVEVHELPEHRLFKPDDTIIEQGSLPDYVYSLVEGEAEVVRNGKQVATIVAGEIFGAMSILHGERRTASVVAKQHCTVLAVPAAQFDLLIRTSPHLIMGLMKSMAANIVNANDKLLSS
ncbi:Crp/Fnr family transcriptional regulator [Salinibius halmophilus]|uniref:Crp/Fnr family transcriptional regulator n=1 Tax=Salinibius halmophilus TaxID=1853216 RepID=UPI000E6618E3|nr:cyclic nucleotide-binding domain-containing protein [Salinibius halmophilus]